MHAQDKINRTIALEKRGKLTKQIQQQRNSNHICTLRDSNSVLHSSHTDRLNKGLTQLQYSTILY
uniref:Uncharacterized protein n=1 Tax=Arundo donax TaxID=35708 RepID=A0A0A9GRV7_ARUDO